MNRAAVVAALVADLRVQIRVAKDRAKATVESATHAESKQENDKDTRALEETYLAAGQAQRVAQLELDLLAIRSHSAPPKSDVVVVGALVEIEDDERSRRLFVSARGGGMSVTVDGVDVQVISPGSPLGRAIIGRSEGDEISLRLKGGVRVYEIVSHG
jgi:transcription elongation GreA/GreB family factor